MTIFKKNDKTFKETTDLSKKNYHHFCLIDQMLLFIMTIMDILNHFNLSLVNVGIIHQNLEEMVGQITTLIISFLFI